MTVSQVANTIESLTYSVMRALAGTKSSSMALQVKDELDQVGNCLIYNSTWKEVAASRILVPVVIWEEPVKGSINERC